MIYFLTSSGQVLLFKKIKIYYFIVLCVYVWVNVCYIYMGAFGSLMRISHSLELELQSVPYCLSWVVRTELLFSGRTAYILSCWAISPAPRGGALIFTSVHFSVFACLCIVGHCLCCDACVETRGQHLGVRCSFLSSCGSWVWNSEVIQLGTSAFTCWDTLPPPRSTLLELISYVSFAQHLLLFCGNHSIASSFIIFSCAIPRYPASVLKIICTNKISIYSQSQWQHG